MMLRYKLSRQNSVNRVSSRSMRSYMRSIDADSISTIANADKSDDEEEDHDDEIPTTAPTENEQDGEEDEDENAFYASNKQSMKSITTSSSSQKFKNKSYATKKKKTTKSNGNGESKGDDTMFIKNLNDINTKKKNGVPSTIIVDGDHHDDGDNNFENENDYIIVPPCKNMDNNANASINNNPVVVVVVPPHVPIIIGTENDHNSSFSSIIAATPINNNKYSSVFPTSAINNDSRGTPASVVQVLGSISSSSLFPLPLPPTVSPETIIFGEGGGREASTPAPKSPLKRVSLDHSIHEQLGHTTSNNGGGGVGGSLYNNNNNNNNNNSSMAMSGMSSTIDTMMNSSFIANGVANSIYGTSVMDSNNNIINCTSSNSIRESLGYHYGFIDYNNQGPNCNSVQQQVHQQQQQQRYRNGFDGAVGPSTPAQPSTPASSTTSTNTTPPPPMLPLVAQTSQRTFTAASTLVSIMSTNMMAPGGSPMIRNIINNKRARADPMLYELSKSKSNTKSTINNNPSSSKKKKHKKIHRRREFSNNNNNIFDHARLSLNNYFSTAANDADTPGEDGEEKDVSDFGASLSSMIGTNDDDDDDDDDCFRYGSSNNSTAAAAAPKKSKNKKTMIQQDDTDEGDDVDDDAVVVTTTTTTTTTTTNTNNHPFKRIPRRFVDDPSLPTIKGGMRLAVSNDKQHLNSLHCFVRSELLEVFVLDDIENDEEDAPSNNQYCNRVGLRCVQCGRKSKKDRHGTSMSTFFPKSIEDIYRGVCTWQRIHFKDCQHMPDHFREKYDHLKEIDRTRGKKVHWVKSAREMGFRNADEDRSGVIYDPDGKVAAATATARAEGSMLLEALTSVHSEASGESELFATSTAIQATTGVTTMSSSLAEYQAWA